MEGHRARRNLASHASRRSFFFCIVGVKVYLSVSSHGARLCYPYISSKARGGIPEPAPAPAPSLSPLDVAVPLFSPYRYVALLFYVRSGDYLRWRVFDLLNRKCQLECTSCVPPPRRQQQERPKVVSFLLKHLSDVSLVRLSELLFEQQSVRLHVIRATNRQSDSCKLCSRVLSMIEQNTEFVRSIREVCCRCEMV